nr:NADH dehydrogenase subunit 1 [Cimex lectularius]
MFLISFLFLVLCILVAVAFVTLMERKILGYIQLRSGPNKVGLMGLLQPFSDGLKLFFKEQSYPCLSNFFIYYCSPVLMMILSFMLWCLFPFLVNVYFFSFGFLFMMVCLGVGVYGVMISGWSSNSNYAMLGSLRSVAQTISYEVSMALLALGVVFLTGGFDFIDFMTYQQDVWFVFFSFPIFGSWYISCLAETNRSPFDFAEGESELVSGFNIEYSSGGFAFIFLSEYMNILFMSTFTLFCFRGADLGSLLFSFLMFCVGFIWVRGTLPRYRYDKLMYMTWKSFLPISLNYLLIIISIF